MDIRNQKKAFPFDTPCHTLLALCPLLLGLALFAVSLIYYRGPGIPRPDAVPPVSDFPSHWQTRLHQGERIIFTVQAQHLAPLLRESIPILEVDPEREFLVSFGAPLQRAHLHLDRPIQGEPDGKIYLYTAPGRVLYSLPPPRDLLEI